MLDYMLLHQYVVKFSRELLSTLSTNISIAFDKVWHEGLLFKLEHIGISGNLSVLNG